ncbi:MULTISPECIES: hydantoinase B/oxoprolinase family protein [unclassified Roseitalea]|uniref:hydantoinase B/oxoprolinase family protein n=1 Tax=unclassified Roseitalea TaxID=2639107 RepID=UPI00273EFC44|nr:MULTISPECIES: hydantoinase B/oxoprolinase family protein [unclassified Roseitalea]
MTAATRAADGAFTAIVQSYINAAANEMRATLVRTAFTPVIYDVLDFGISIYDARLDLIGEAPGLTFFLGANDYSVRKVLEYHGTDTLAPGDIIISNYPYWNGAHVSDATLLAPVFDPERGDLLSVLVVRAHWMDLGAKDPGYVLDSTDMHQEGLVFPATKLYRKGKANPEIIEIIRFNSRMPDLVIGDMHAQVAALRTGERRMHEILGKFGRDDFEAALAGMHAHGEAATRAALADLPKGSWSASDILDDDGIGTDPVHMQVRVTITDDTFEVDFDGSSAATKGPVNMPFGATVAMCKVLFKSLTTPDEPSSAGQMRALSIKAEPGTLFHAVYPAPTFTLWTGIVALELVLKALSQAMPDRLAASSGGDVPGFMMLGIHPDTGQMFAVSNNDPVGWGGAPTHDGSNALIHLSESIVRSTSTEIMETKTTMLMERVEVTPDSGGPGRYRGGLGLTRDIRFLTDGEFLTVIKKTKSPPWGLAGGANSTPNQIVLFPGTDKERNVSTQRVAVRAGERVRVISAGGGGYGPASERPRDAIKADLAEGYVTPEGARRDYGHE